MSQDSYLILYIQILLLFNNKIFEIINEQIAKININKEQLKLDLDTYEKDYLSKDQMEED